MGNLFSASRPKIRLCFVQQRYIGQRRVESKEVVGSKDFVVVFSVLVDLQIIFVSRLACRKNLGNYAAFKQIIPTRP